MTFAKRTLTALTTRAILLATVPAFAAGLLINSTPVMAQDMSNGADNFYKSDKVTVQKVSFKNQYQMHVAGNLFTPKTLNRNGKAPALIVGHPMGAVKEQSANLYATTKASYGFDDAIYAALRLIRAVSQLGGSLTQLRSAMPPM